MPQEKYGFLIDHKGYRSQHITNTGTSNAHTVMHPEQGRVGRTLNMSQVQAQETVRHPVQRCAGMRTTVEIPEYSVGCAHEKDVTAVIAACHGQTAASRHADVIKSAEQDSVS